MGMAGLPVSVHRSVELKIAKVINRIANNLS